MNVVLEQLPRATTTLILQGVRLPLTVFEAVARRGQDNANWPPALAFERVEATVKETVGRFVNDESLMGLATLQHAEVGQREQVLAKSAEADAVREESRRKADARQSELTRRRHETELRADNRERSAEEERRRAKQRVAKQTAKQAATTQKATAARKAAIDKQALKAEATRHREEAAALHAKKNAAAAKRKVSDLDKAVRARKARRTG